jgi:hypothetical protein
VVIADLLQRLAEQQAAIAAAQAALHRLVELGLDRARDVQEREEAVQAATLPAEAASPVLAAAGAAQRACQVCGEPLPARRRGAGQPRRYCSVKCAQRACRARKAERAAAADRAQARAILEQNVREGIENLQWRTPNGPA